MVSVLVSFGAVRPRSQPAPSALPPQVRTPPPVREPSREQLESPLRATPHEFESRTLRQCLTGHDVEGPRGVRRGPSTAAWPHDGATGSGRFHGAPGAG